MEGFSLLSYTEEAFLRKLEDLTKTPNFAHFQRTVTIRSRLDGGDPASPGENSSFGGQPHRTDLGFRI